MQDLILALGAKTQGNGRPQKALQGDLSSAVGLLRGIIGFVEGRVFIYLFIYSFIIFL